MVDPRISIIDERLRAARQIIAVSSGKGGVGKSLVACTLALILAERGYKIGLLDLDFTSPSTDVILGVRDSYPREENGIIPPMVHGIRYMSIVYYSRDSPLPLRGVDISNALTELLAVTRWGDLDFLILDMPPGTSDLSLDVLKLVKAVKFLIVTTPSQLAFKTVDKLLDLLGELRTPIAGVIENMKMGESASIQRRIEERGIKFWGGIPFDPKMEEAIGDAARLMETSFGRRLRELVQRNLWDV